MHNEDEKYEFLAMRVHLDANGSGGVVVQETSSGAEVVMDKEHF